MPDGFRSWMLWEEDFKVEKSRQDMYLMMLHVIDSVGRDSWDEVLEKGGVMLVQFCQAPHLTFTLAPASALF